MSPSLFLALHSVNYQDTARGNEEWAREEGSNLVVWGSEIQTLRIYKACPNVDT